MGFSKKSQAEANLESDKKWVIAGISIRASLKPIATKQRHRDGKTTEAHKEDADEATTPTAREARIAAQVSCPPAPRKRRTPVKCHVNSGREFFNPPDLESVFKLGGQVERAN